MPVKRRAAKRRDYRGEHFWDLLLGPTEEDEKASPKELLELWERGGRDAIMNSSFRKPGWRPWGFWFFDLSDRDYRRIERTRCQAEAVLKLGLCDDAERQAIIEDNVIAEQLAEIAEEESSCG